MLFGSRWAAAFALLASPAILADFESAEITALGGIHPDGISVYQVIVNFDDVELVQQLAHRRLRWVLSPASLHKKPLRYPLRAAGRSGRACGRKCYRSSGGPCG